MSKKTLKMYRLILILTLCIAFPAMANPLLEERYCGSPKRNAKGEIIRRADVLAAFRKVHPCPSTGLKTGACNGWQMNHDLPLACGGCDAVSNITWKNTLIKTCAKPYCIDRYELKINQAPYPIADTAKCKNEIVLLE